MGAVSRDPRTGPRWGSSGQCVLLAESSRGGVFQSEGSSGSSEGWNRDFREGSKKRFGPDWLLPGSGVITPPVWAEESPQRRSPEW